MERKVISAFILCGGLGTRLRPVLNDRPKSMAFVGGVPFLQLLIERLRSQQVREIVLGTGYLAESIRGHFAEGKQLGVNLTYSEENQPLGTAGAVRNAESHLSDPTLVMNGDSYAEWDLDAIQTLMAEKRADAVMVLQRVSEVARYGSVEVEKDNRVRQFVEKGTKAGAGLINAGVYLLRKDIISNLPEGVALSLERDVFPGLLDRRVYGCIAEGSFIDIGIPEDLLRAQTLLAPLARSSANIQALRP